MQIKKESLLHFERAEFEMLASVSNQKTRLSGGAGVIDMGVTLAVDSMSYKRAWSRERGRPRRGPRSSDLEDW